MHETRAQFTCLAREEKHSQYRQSDDEIYLMLTLTDNQTPKAWISLKNQVYFPTEVIEIYVSFWLSTPPEPFSFCLWLNPRTGAVFVCTVFPQ